MLGTRSYQLGATAEAVEHNAFWRPFFQQHPYDIIMRIAIVDHERQVAALC